MYELKSKVKKICDSIGVDVEEYYKRCKDMRHSDLRRTIQYILHAEGVSIYRISKDCGRKHPTVLHNVNVCRMMIHIQDHRTIELLNIAGHGS